MDEVQHGIAAAKSPVVMRFLAENKIRLNICPTSNVMLGRVERLKDHPIRKHYDAGVNVTVNTDDALVFGATISEEFTNMLHEVDPTLVSPAAESLRCPLWPWGVLRHYQKS